jgi:hypothetical protein
VATLKGQKAQAHIRCRSVARANKRDISAMGQRHGAANQLQRRDPVIDYIPGLRTPFVYQIEDFGFPTLAN